MRLDNLREGNQGKEISLSNNLDLSTGDIAGSRVQKWRPSLCLLFALFPLCSQNQLARKMETVCAGEKTEKLELKVSHMFVQARILTTKDLTLTF